MEKLTKEQKIIIIIYLGSCYSTFRDNNLEKIKIKAQAYLNKFENRPLEQYNGGFSLMMIKKILSGNFKQESIEIDDTLKKVWLSMTMGMELACLISKTTPKIILPIVRFFIAPHLNDKNFQAWVMKYQKELFAYISLIDGLEDVKNDNIYNIIFNNN
jgi:hypothetical protein